MAEKIKQPLTKGVCKVPLIMQMEALECGAASLAMILAYYDKWIPIEQIRIDTGVSRDGANAKNILIAARNYGLTAKGYRYEIDDLKENGKFPCIIHWNFNHFVVLKGFRGNKAYLNDPAKGNYAVSMETFDKSYTGICLMFTPSETFIPSGHKKSVMKYAFNKLKGAKVTVLFVVLTSLIAALMRVISPGFSRIFIDRLLTKESPNWFYPFLICLACFSFLEILIDILRAYYSNKMNGKLATVGSSTFLWKVLHLPMSFFSQRLAGDIQSRQESNASIANTIITTITPLALDFIMAIFYLVVMIRYSWILTLVGLSSIFINMFIARIISNIRINITRVQMRDVGKLSGASIAGVEMIETIKASGAENGFFEKWGGYQANVNNAKVKYARLDQYIGIIPSIFSTITQTIILVLGIYLIMQGKFTIGMVMAFQGLLTSFLSPMNALINSSHSIQEMRTEMERLEDVMLYKDDPCYDVHTSDTDYHKLKGEIEVKNLSFSYSPLGQLVVKDFNMHIKPGQRIAIVGSSGCGKSTISKLISGLYQPISGEILYDGKHLNEIDRDVFTGSLAVVDQDIILFEDSVNKNIKMWNNTIEDFEMILAAKDAQIHEEIMSRDGGYNYKIKEGGKDFSGGQRQKLEIARVLALDPSILILDEATSALDAKSEYDVVQAIKDRGITCIIIAHRLSTIRDCDEIIVLEDGEVKERGTHEQLYAMGGLYTDLISHD